ncbi:acyl-homoserine-lactone synthase [Pseudomonas citronellolis]|uniref:acyl-homoserine-lactone synthase n=1 Tax=Pseudomonas citronellolis TaxID=53408 RepID=UPI0022BA3BAF|nr:acyl-homoserine-lactone synthase [Pseudomonas citronellolis]WBG61835.1 GNAT family N-acetyltransferase [Pseudomonas citronellolis]
MHCFEYTCFTEMDQAARESLGRFRHAVFIQRLGWEVAGTQRDQGLEFDQFDGAHTHYVIARDPDGAIVGCTRLLPTTQPYLLGEVFPHLCEQAPASNPATWEISRYAATSTDPQLGIALFKATIRLARAMGASDVVAVTNCALERYFKQHGVTFSRLGTPVSQEHQRLVSLKFPADQFSTFPHSLLARAAAWPARPQYLVPAC